MSKFRDFIAAHRRIEANKFSEHGYPFTVSVDGDVIYGPNRSHELHLFKISPIFIRRAIECGEYGVHVKVHADRNVLQINAVSDTYPFTGMSALFQLDTLRRKLPEQGEHLFDSRFEHELEVTISKHLRDMKRMARRFRLFKHGDLLYVGHAVVGQASNISRIKLVAKCAQNSQESNMRVAANVVVEYGSDESLRTFTLGARVMDPDVFKLIITQFNIDAAGIKDIETKLDIHTSGELTHRAGDPIPSITK